MSLRKGNRGEKKKATSSIELKDIIGLVRFIQILSGAILIISLIGISFVGSDSGAQAIYTTVILINVFVLLFSMLPIKYFKVKSIEQTN